MVGHRVSLHLQKIENVTPYFLKLDYGPAIVICTEDQYLRFLKEFLQVYYEILIFFLKVWLLWYYISYFPS